MHSDFSCIAQHVTKRNVLCEASHSMNRSINELLGTEVLASYFTSP